MATVKTKREPMTPKALATEIAGAENAERFAKQLRAFLRATYPRPVEAKNSAWLVPPEACDAARAHFAKRQAK